MHKTSAQYKEIISGAYDVEIEAEVNGITYGWSQIESSSTVAELFGREAPAVGNAIARQFNLSIITPSAPLPIGAKCKIRGRVRNGSQASEWIPKGEFYIDTRKRNKLRDGADTTTDIFGYDALIKGNVDFPDSDGWPKIDAAVVAEAADILGVNVACNLTRGYFVSKPEDMTISEVLGYVAAMYGGNFYVNDFGQLDICLLKKESPLSIAPAALSIGESVPGITRVVLHRMDGTQFVSESGTGRTIDVDCPWATQTMADNLLQQLRGYAYQPFSVADTAVDLALEIGDTVSVSGATERIYSMEQVLGSVTMAALSAPDVKEMDHSYYPNKNGLSSGMGRIAAKAEETRQLAVEVSSGLHQIAIYNPESGYAIAEAALYAEILDSSMSPPQIKSSRISTAVIRASDGSMKSMAEILADVINLNGRVNLTGSLAIRDGNLYCSNDVAYFSTINAKYPDFSDAGSMRLSNRSFVPRSVTLADGSTITVLAEGSVPSTLSEEGD